MPRLAPWEAVMDRLALGIAVVLLWLRRRVA